MGLNTELDVSPTLRALAHGDVFERVAATTAAAPREPELFAAEAEAAADEQQWGGEAQDNENGAGDRRATAVGSRWPGGEDADAAEQEQAGQAEGENAQDHAAGNVRLG